MQPTTPSLMPFPAFAKQLGTSEHLALLAIENGTFDAPLIVIGARRFVRAADAEAVLAALRAPRAQSTQFVC